jgi:hypothetical protein
MALTERGFERKRGTGGYYWWVGIGLVEANSSEPGATHPSPAVNQVNDSEPKNGIHSSAMVSRGGIRQFGSLGSLGSLDSDPGWPVDQCEKVDGPPTPSAVPPPPARVHGTQTAVDGPPPSTPVFLCDETLRASQAPQIARGPRQWRSMDTLPDAGTCPTIGCPGRLKTTGKGASAAVFCPTCKHRAYMQTAPPATVTDAYEEGTR